MRPYDKFEIGDILKVESRSSNYEGYSILEVIAKNKKCKYKFIVIKNTCKKWSWKLLPWYQLNIKHEVVIKLTKDELMVELL